METKTDSGSKSEKRVSAHSENFAGWEVEVSEKNALDLKVPWMDDLYFPLPNALWGDIAMKGCL